MNWLLIVLILLLAALLYAADKAAIFTPAKVFRKTYHKMRIAYTTTIGPYKDSYKSNAFVEEYLKSKTGKDYTMEPCLGIYFDNPKEVKPEECRAVVAKIIDEDTQIDESPDGKIKITEIELTDSATIEFPFKSALAIMPCIVRAYPALSKFLIENKLEYGAAPIEFYGYPKGKISFVAPIGKYDGILTEFPKAKSE